LQGIQGILVPRAAILLASATDRELWRGPRLPIFVNDGSRYCFKFLRLAESQKSVIRGLPACQSSRSVALAKRIAALGTRMYSSIKIPSAGGASCSARLLSIPHASKNDNILPLLEKLA